MFSSSKESPLCQIMAHNEPLKAGMPPQPCQSCILQSVTNCFKTPNLSVGRPSDINLASVCSSHRILITLGGLMSSAVSCVIIFMLHYVPSLKAQREENNVPWWFESQPSSVGPLWRWDDTVPPTLHLNCACSLLLHRQAWWMSTEWLSGFTYTSAGRQCCGERCHGCGKITFSSLIMWTSNLCSLTKQAATPGSQEQVAPTPRKSRLSKLTRKTLH